MTEHKWVVERDIDELQAAEALGAEPEWTVYALGDLEPPFDQYSSVSVARAGSIGSVAACLTLRHPAFTVVMSAGDPDGLEAVLNEMDLPAGTLVSIREDHREVFERRFTFPRGLNRMRRMVLERRTVLPEQNRGIPAVRLDAADASELLDLYVDYAGNSFSPDHLVAGVFYGVREAGQLVSAAGTHVVSHRHGAAAIGSVFTRPEHRGQGFAGCLTAAVAEELRASGCNVIALNVGIENAAAERVYRRLGFRDHCFFLEGMGTRR